MTHFLNVIYKSSQGGLVFFFLHFFQVKTNYRFSGPGVAIVKEITRLETAAAEQVNE